MGVCVCVCLCLHLGLSTRVRASQNNTPTVWCVCAYSASKKAKPIDLQGLNSFSQRAHFGSLLCALWVSCAALVVLFLLNLDVRAPDTRAESWRSTISQNLTVTEMFFVNTWVCNNRRLKKSCESRIKESMNISYSDIFIIKLFYNRCTLLAPWHYRRELRTLLQTLFQRQEKPLSPVIFHDHINRAVNHEKSPSYRRPQARRLCGRPHGAHTTYSHESSCRLDEFWQSWALTPLRSPTSQRVWPSVDFWDPAHLFSFFFLALPDLSYSIWSL